jgi:hypothetical protein
VAVDTSGLLLPARARLLHIGFHKTGTTALQTAAQAVSHQLTDHGVTVPGDLRWHHRAALGVRGQTWGWDDESTSPVSARYWYNLCHQSRQATGRVLISSEFFCESDDADVREIVEGLSPGVHVVVTTRPLGKILPSAWQQYIKYGLRTPYEKWLHTMLDAPGSSTITPTFWQRHDHGAVLARWSAVVGPENVTVVVLDEQDRTLVYRAFSAMLGLPEGLLVEVGTVRGNRSMSLAEAELFRRVNVEGRRHDLLWADYSRVLRYGAILRMVEERAPAATEEKIQVPRWAAERAAELGAGFVSTIDRLGVRVVGDLGCLAEEVPSVEALPDDPTDVPIAAAVEAVLGAVSGSLHGNAVFIDQSHEVDRRLLSHVTVRELIGVVCRRLAGGVGWRLRRTRTRLRRRLRATPAPSGDVRSELEAAQARALGSPRLAERPSAGVVHSRPRRSSFPG